MEQASGLKLIDRFFYRDDRAAYYAHLCEVPKPDWHVANRAPIKGMLSVDAHLFGMAKNSAASQVQLFDGAGGRLVRISMQEAHSVLTWAGSATGLSYVHAASQLATQKWHFHNFYHPYACDLMGILFRSGVNGLLRWADPPLQLQNDDHANDVTAFELAYEPVTAFVTTPYPREEFDFSFSGAYSIYNWELFFHIPMLLAVRLTDDRRFEEARRWLHAIFDPTDVSNIQGPQRFWKVKPFYENQDLSDILTDMLTLHPVTSHGQILKYKLGNNGDESPTVTLEQQIAAWRENPFNPHLIARMRPLAYQKTTVMRYVDNLIDWGDDLFRQDTMETINEATMLYVLAADLLGPKPTIIEPFAEPVVKTYAELEASLDAFSNVNLENLLSSAQWLPVADPNAPVPPCLDSLYFGIPPNDQLLGYWDIVADRLFKIRHCMNIEGVVRELPLYEPPIDPGLLVRAAAMGIDLSSVLSDLRAPAPFYRFTLLQQKAVDFAQSVTALGGGILVALEKRDAEQLAQLRAGQESSVLALVKETRKAQIKEAEQNLAALDFAQRAVEERVAFYGTVQYISPSETLSMAKSHEASVMQGVSQGIQAAAAGLYVIPTFGIGFAGAMGSPLSSATIGGDPFGKATEAAAAIVSMLGTVARDDAQTVGTLGTYERRWADWKLQERLARAELDQVKKQIAAAQIRVAIAQSELASHDLQIQNAKEVEDYLRDKFTNDELYDWMASELSDPPRARARPLRRRAVDGLLPELQARLRHGPQRREGLPVRARGAQRNLHFIRLLGQPTPGPVRRREAAARPSAHGVELPKQEPAGV